MVLLRLDSTDDGRGVDVVCDGEAPGDGSNGVQPLRWSAEGHYAVAFRTWSLDLSGIGMVAAEDGYVGHDCKGWARISL